MPKTAFLFLSLSLLFGLGGCSGEPAPRVGDAEIARGIERREMPKPTSPQARQAAEAYARARQRHR